MRLPRDDDKLKVRLLKLRQTAPVSIVELSVLLGQFVLGRADPLDLTGLRKALEGVDADWRLRGLRAVTTTRFFSHTFPGILEWALILDPLMREYNFVGLPYLLQGENRQLRIPRPIVVSLLAHMFLCTLPEPPAFLDMPRYLNFRNLLQNSSKRQQEVTRLQMFLFFFDIANPKDLEIDLRGEIVIDRIANFVGSQDWIDSRKPLLRMEVQPKGVGFEDAPALAHADFANKYIGGGVLSRGSVQEEIRFTICPELLVALLVCPKMEAYESLQICGAEHFVEHSGYASSLAFEGRHRDTAERLRDGSVKSCIMAMDAQRFSSNTCLEEQMDSGAMFRDLNKAHAAFTPVPGFSDEYPQLATGNWGAGAFNGFAELKALLQWAAASQWGRHIVYFPYDKDFGPALQKLSAWAETKRISVSHLVRALCQLRHVSLPPEQLFEAVQGTIAALACDRRDGEAAGMRSRSRRRTRQD